jgi:hypothetical protein
MKKSKCYFWIKLNIKTSNGTPPDKTNPLNNGTDVMTSKKREDRI